MKVPHTIISYTVLTYSQSKTRRKLTKIIWLLIDKDHVLEKQIPNVSFTLKNVKKYRRHCCAISLCILMASQVAIKAALTNSGGFLRLETRKYTKLHLNALFSVQFARLVPTGLFHPSVPAGKCISIIFRTIFLFALTSLPFLRHYLPFGKKTRGIFPRRYLFIRRIQSRWLFPSPGDLSISTFKFPANSSYGLFVPKTRSSSLRIHA